MKENYHADSINNALKHAMAYYTFDGKAIERILAATATRRTLESFRVEKARQQLGQALPKIKQCPLEEYNILTNRNSVIFFRISATSTLRPKKSFPVTILPYLKGTVYFLRFTHFLKKKCA